MANSLVSFREDETRRIEASKICEDIGIDLQTYLRICIARLIQEKGIPFSMKKEEKLSRGMKAIIEANKTAEQYGIQDMSLDEINAEIEEVRKSHK